MSTPRRAWLFDELRTRYEHPLEIEAYTRQVNDGLLAEERALLQSVSTEPGPALVLGCGAGREVFALAQKGYDVTGVDISQGMLRAAEKNEKQFRKHAPSIKKRIAWVWMDDPLRLPLSDQTYSIVVAFAQLISHIPNRISRIQLFEEIYRVLKPEGFFVASFTDRDAASRVYDLSDVNRMNVLGDLDPAARWEKGDLLIWNPSDADLEEPLFFHLHTHQNICTEIGAARLRVQRIVMPRELTPTPQPDAHLYPFVVATRPASNDDDDAPS